MSELLVTYGAALGGMVGFAPRVSCRAWEGADCAAWSRSRPSPAPRARWSTPATTSSASRSPPPTSSARSWTRSGQAPGRSSPTSKVWPGARQVFADVESRIARAQRHPSLEQPRRHLAVRHPLGDQPHDPQLRLRERAGGRSAAGRPPRPLACAGRRNRKPHMARVLLTCRRADQALRFHEAGVGTGRPCHPRGGGKPWKNSMTLSTRWS